MSRWERGFGRSDQPAHGALEIAGIGGGGEGRFLGDSSFAEGSEQGAQEGLGFRGLAAIEMIPDIGQFFAANPRTGGARIFQEFAEHGHAAIWAGSGDEDLAEYPDELHGKQEQATGALPIGEHGVESFEGIDAVGAVQRAEDQVTGFARLECGESGFGVADFTKENDIWGLSQGGAQGPRERMSVGSYFALGEKRMATGELVFDRVFQRDDVFLEVGINPFQAGGEGG